MSRSMAFFSRIATVVFAGAAAMPLAAQEEQVVKAVNDPILRLTEANKSYKVLFDAAIDMTPAPSPSGRADASFNLNTIHPKMADWSKVRDWAEANPMMAEAILSSRDRIDIGLPYGDDIDQKYKSAGIYADIAVDGNLRARDFAYLDTIDTIAAYSAAECHRLMEADQAEKALDLAIAHLYVVDQLCERPFLAEKMHAMQLMIDSLEGLRELMHLYFDKLSLNQYSGDGYDGADGKERKGVAFELPYLRLDLPTIPEGDRIAASAMIDSVFSTIGEADPTLFSETFAKIQSQDAAFTLFGAAKRWKLVSRFHGSRLATQEQLTEVYDDWWRRWGIRAWHPFLELTPQYQRINPIRFAAVVYSLRDINDIFLLRRQLVAAANGTVLAAGICGYRKQFGSDPDDIEKTYATYVRRRQDVDPFDRDGGRFGYRRGTTVRVNAEGLGDFITVDGGLLWAKGADFESDRGAEHSRDGLTGDIVFWPPMRTLAREQGLMQ